MAKGKIGTHVASKRHRGCYTYHGRDGKTFSFMVKVDGKNKRFQVGREDNGFSLQIAEEERNKMLQKLKLGQAIPDKLEAITFSRAYKLWLEHMEKVGASAVPNYQSKYNQRFKKWFAHEPLAAITPGKLRVFQRALVKEGHYAPTTINAFISTIRNLYKFALGEGLYAGANPADLVKPVSTEPTEEELMEDVRTFTDEEVAKLLRFLYRQTEGVDGLRWAEAYAQVCLGFFMGFRVHELTGNGNHKKDVGVWWDRIDWKEGTLKFLRKGPNDGKWAWFYMPEIVKDAIKLVQSKKHGSAKYTGKVFRFKWHSRRPINQARELLFGVQKGKSRKESESFHKFRHTLATKLYEVSGNERLVSVMLSHTIQKKGDPIQMGALITQDYIHFEKTLKEEGKRLIDEWAAQFHPWEDDGVHAPKTAQVIPLFGKVG